MSSNNKGSNLPYKQVANVNRRTWDVETYERKAQERQERGAGGSNLHKSSTASGANGHAAAATTNDEKEEFRPADSSRAGPERSKRAFLKARSSKVADIDSRVGKTEIVSAATAAGGVAAPALKTDDASAAAVVKTGVGWHCRVCDCFLKDSHTYLDHINGRKHQAKLGYSMRVERSSAEQVKARLEALTKLQEQQEGQNEEDELNFEDMVRAKDEAEERRREERRRKRKERKKKLHQEGGDSSELDEAEKEEPTATETTSEPTEERIVQTTNDTTGTDVVQKSNQQQEGDEEEEEIDDGGIDPAMEAMMGFSGFGGGNKKR